MTWALPAVVLGTAAPSELVAACGDPSCASECSRCLVFVFKQRSGESVKVHQLDVAIPLHLKSQLRKGPPLGGGEGEAEAADTMPFAMLTRKGNKQQVRRRPLRPALDWQPQ